jgi:hypothetical protein
MAGGTNFTDIILLGGLAVGVYLFYTECIVKSACGLPGGGGETPVDPNAVIDPGVGGDDPGVSDPSSTSNCKSLCTAGDCDGYDDENCTAGCSKCKSGGGSGGTGGTSSGGAVSCNDGHTCKKRCDNRWCTSFKKCCKGESCARCTGGGTRVCSCRKGMHVADRATCRCATNKGVKVSQTKKPKPTGKAAGGQPKYKCCAGNTCTMQSTPAKCCTWRGSHGGCPSKTGWKGVMSGSKCNCVKSSGYGRALSGYARGYYVHPGMPIAPLNQGTFGQGGAFSRQQAFRQTYQFPRNTYRRAVSMSNSSGMRIPHMMGIRRGYV